MKIEIVIARMALPLLMVAALSMGGPAHAAKVDLNLGYRQIAAELASTGPESVDLAEADIRNMVKNQAFACGRQLCSVWLPKLMAKRQYQFVAEIARREIFNAPAWPVIVQRALRFRIAALLALGQYREALAEVKSLFDECPMRGVGAALSMVTRCLRAASPDGAALARRLKREQIVGAMAPQPGAPPATCPVLSGIKVEAAAYLTQAWGRLGQSYYDLMGRGDLLLLADRPREAIKYFREVAAMANNQRDFLFDESNVCRAMKAEDGTIGRANAHLLAVVRETPR